MEIEITALRERQEEITKEGHLVVNSFVVNKLELVVTQLVVVDNPNDNKHTMMKHISIR